MEFFVVSQNVVHLLPKSLFCIYLVFNRETFENETNSHNIDVYLFATVHLGFQIDLCISSGQHEDLFRFTLCKYRHKSR